MLLHEIQTLDGGVIIRNAKGSSLETSDLKQALVWLNHAQFGLCAFWDLDEAVAQLLRLMPENLIRELAQRKRVDIDGETDIFYMRGHVLSIGYQRQNKMFYGLSPFFNYDYRKDTKPSLIIQQQMADQFMTDLASVGIRPYRLTSHAALVDGLFKSLNASHRLPTYLDCPDEANDIAWNITGNAWNEAHRIGLFHNCFDADLASAYPFILTKLMDTRYGTWWKSDKYEPSAEYGFINLKTNIPQDAKIVPFCYADNSGVYFASGKYPTKCEKHLLDAWLKYNPMPTVKITSAWWWKPNHSPVYPLDIVVRRLFNGRKVSPTLDKALKRAMAATYGLLLMVFEDDGEITFTQNFNPVWGAIIEDGTKARDYEFIKSNKADDKVIVIKTDGVTFTEPIPNI